MDFCYLSKFYVGAGGERVFFVLNLDQSFPAGK